MEFFHHVSGPYGAQAGIFQRFDWNGRKSSQEIAKSEWNYAEHHSRAFVGWERDIESAKPIEINTIVGRAPAHAIMTGSLSSLSSPHVVQASWKSISQIAKSCELEKVCERCLRGFDSRERFILNGPLETDLNERLRCFSLKGTRGDRSAYSVRIYKYYLKKGLL